MRKEVSLLQMCLGKLLIRIIEIINNIIIYTNDAFRTLTAVFLQLSYFIEGEALTIPWAFLY